MKKFVAILLALITLFAVLGCQNAAVTKTAEPMQTPETTKAQDGDGASEAHFLSSHSADTSPSL